MTALKQQKKTALEFAAERTYEIRQLIKALEEEAKSLRPILESVEGKVEAGEFVVGLSTRERRDLDKTALKARLGDEYSAFEKVSSYAVIDIKKK